MKENDDSFVSLSPLECLLVRAQKYKKFKIYKTMKRME